MAIWRVTSRPGHVRVKIVWLTATITVFPLRKNLECLWWNGGTEKSWAKQRQEKVKNYARPVISTPVSNNKDKKEEEKLVSYSISLW
jgi:hypothetical protein